MLAFNDEIRRLELDYIADKDIIIRTFTDTGEERGRNPDVGVVNASQWNTNVLPYGALIVPIQLAVEVTSTNWDDDYVDKLDEYQRLGISEYWIVDYLAIASRAYLGNPKLPTVFVYQLVEGHYQVQKFTGNDRILSSTFPELALTVKQVVAASQIQKLSEVPKMVWTPIHAKIHRTIRSRHLFERNQRLLIAVSGGQDSLCLIKLLLDLESKWGWNLGIAHCDHRWRSDSEANAHHVENLAKTWDTSFYLETANEPINSEAAARDWRYQALSAIAKANNYQYIVTGHTASDRAETLLYNLIRGTGADGLQALTWQRPLNTGIMLVRPLLEITRIQTEQFCQEFKLPIWEDSTNQDLQYARNRIRQELIPYLRENFNPQVESALAQTAELLQAEVEYLEKAAQQLREEALGMGENEKLPLSPLLPAKSSPAFSSSPLFPTTSASLRDATRTLSTSPHSPLPLRLNRRVLQKAPLALQRRVMRQVLQQILTDAPSFEHIEKLTALIIAPNRSQTDPFPGGAIAQVEGDWICLK